MAGQLNSIVILYEGTQPTEETISLLKEVLKEICSSGDILVSVYSGENISDIMMKETILHTVEKPDLEPENKTPEDEAIIYIGTLMEEELKEPFDKVNFMHAIINRTLACKKLPTSESNKRFMNALFILSQEDLKISKSLLEKYNFDREKILTIKKVYNFCNA